ncbi:MAG: MFS transporter [Janthinobacterium lividum]
MDTTSHSPPLALAALSLSTLLAALGTSIANVGLPALSAHFAAPYARIQWIVLAYLLASTAVALAAGRLGDRYGRRRVLLGGIALFGAASLACGLAPSLPWLVAARGVQGIGAAAMLALTLPFVADTLPEGRSGRAIGLLGTVSAAGTALGPVLGGAVLGGFGWRALFLALAPLGVLAFVLAWRSLPAGHSRAAGRGEPMARPWGPLLANGAMTAVVMATLVIGPFHLTRTLGLDSAAVGLAMACGPLAAALAGVPAGRAVDRHGAGPVARAGLACAAAGAALLACLPAAAGIAGYVVPLAALSTGYALFQAANSNALMAACEARQRGAVSGLLALSRNLGLIAGASAMGMLFAAAGMRMAFLAALLLVALAFLAWRFSGMRDARRAASGDECRAARSGRGRDRP